jgi:nucleoside-diphosphate-sugar epimerase
MPKTRAVLVTGSAGWIGRAVCAELITRGHRVRGLDRVPSPALADAVVCDVVNPDDLARALADMDIVVHLAATPDEADFLTSLLPNNVVGLYHTLEAARHARLARVVLVSSGQLYRGHVGPLPITPATPTSPRNWYALTKVLTEAAGQVYAHAHGLSVVVIRPGWVPRDPAHAAELAASAHGKDSYLSPGDAGRGFAAAVEAEGVPPYTVVHVTSQPLGVARYDLAPARALLGYEPRDRWPQGLGFAPDLGVADVPSIKGSAP